MLHIPTAFFSQRIFVKRELIRYPETYLYASGPASCRNHIFQKDDIDYSLPGYIAHPAGTWVSNIPPCSIAKLRPAVLEGKELHRSERVEVHLDSHNSGQHKQCRVLRNPRHGVSAQHWKNYSATARSADDLQRRVSTEIDSGRYRDRRRRHIALWVWIRLKAPQS